MQIYGEKKQKGGGQKPNIQKDTTASTNFFQGLYGLSEGEVYGLVDGGKSIKLDGTPIINANGQPNFSNVWWDFRTGTIDQEYIKGFSSVENETNVGVELRHDRPYVRTLTNTGLSAIVVRLSWSALREQKDNGGITGYRIDYAIDVQTDGGAWTPMLTTFIHDKASQGYQRSHRIDLPKARRNWTIRVRRITPNRDSELIGDTMSVAAVTEVIDATLAYPCTSLLALRYDAETFGNVAKVAVRMRGMIIQVPTNYDPIARTYTGLWDGTFKMAYSNNPAWVFYDLCTARRYGLGERLAGKVDKWRLYQLGQYCDEMVDDGMGGKEPRFAVNVYLQKAEDAYSVLQNLASVFRAMTYWDGTQIIVDSDTPKDSVYTFGTSNVIDGAFSYTGTRARDRHSIAKVAYDDPDNDYKTEYVFVRDEYAIAKYGIRQLDINAFGCTSKAQATRVGEWAIRSEQLESETVSFSTGLEGFIPQVGDVIGVADNARAGTFVTGRITAVTGNNLTLDRTAGKVGDTFVLGDKTAKITKVSGNTITTDKRTGGQVGQVWAIGSDTVAPREYRVMSIAQNDDATFAITALQYERAKFDDSGVRITPKPVSIIRATVLDAPESVTITSHTRTHQGQAVTTMTVNWSQVVGAVAYIVEWKKDENAWQTQKIASQSLDIDGVYAGNYQAKVRAVDAFGNESDITSSVMTAIAGKTGKPPKLYLFQARGGLFSMQLDWIFNHGSEDTNYTEIQISPDGQANIATLAVFSYPTNSHTITGLQGNLTQFYRARIVDKLGNASDWTDWVRGTTSADAGKVLDILSGQISASHLDQTLRTPIAKIGTLESAVSDISVNSQNNKEVIARLPRSVDVEYYLSNSVNYPVGGSWTTTAPKWIDGKYMWSRTKLTLENGDIQYKPSTNGVCIAGATGATGARGADGIDGRDGAQGLPGRNGVDGRTSYTHLAYANSADGLRDFSLTDANREYIGMYVDFNIADSRTPSSYKWTKVKGADGRNGIAGARGTDGRTPYFHTAWATSADGRQGFSTTVSSGKTYLGTYTDYTEADSTNPSAYTWVLIKGETGATGARGADGIDGRGVQSVSEEYYLSSSSSRLLGGSWQSASPSWDVGKYIWTRSKVVYTDGRIEYSEPHVSSEWQGVYNIANTAKTQVDRLAPTVTEIDKAVGKYGRIRGVVIDNNGVMTGYALMSDIENGHVVSRFGINADNFYIGNPANNKKPFVFTTRPTVIDGVSYPAGAWFNTAHIARASITNTHIADASIDNAKIANASIDSVKIRNGSVGSLQLQDGSVTSAKIGHLAVDTLNIANEAIIVPRALNSGFKEWNGEIEDEVIFAATMNSEQAPVVINLYARVSGAKISDRYNAHSSPPRINLVATHISSGEKEWILGYDEKNPPSFNRFVMSGYMSEAGGNNNDHYFNGGGTAGYFGITREINRNTLLFLPKYSGEYRFELTLTLKGNVRARLYEASMLLMAVKR